MCIPLSTPTPKMSAGGAGLPAEVRTLFQGLGTQQNETLSP